MQPFRTTGLMAIERFFRPERAEGDCLVGFMWSTELRREVPARAWLPRGMTVDEALEAAEAGRLVLDRSMRNLRRAVLS